MHMRTSRLGITGFLAALLFVGMTGCGKETVSYPFPPVATAITPTPGAINVPINVVIAAGFSESMNPASVTSSTFTVVGPTGAVAGVVTYSATGSLATFTPSAPLAYNTLYTATITTGVANTLGIEPAANYIWTFTTITPAPTVISTVPAPGATGVPVNQILTATFSEAMTASTINSTTFTLAGPGGAVTGAVTYNATTFVATFTPSTTLANGTLYTATIGTGAQDLAGTGLATSHAWSFTTIIAPPAVVSTVPVNGATGVRVTQALTATFNEAVTCPTPATDFLVTGPGATTVPGTVTCASNVATFTPTSNLAFSTLYTATITTGVTNAIGTPMASNYVWSFITAPATAAPTVISTVPANLAVNVPVNQAILATFSEAIAPATINTSTFTLAGPGTTAVTGTVTYDASGSVATFTPTAALATNTVYTATITTGVTNLSGTAMASNYVWTFTTAGLTTTTAPTVTSTIPAKLATNVPLNQIVSATFSKPMNPATINSTNFTLQAAGATTTVAGVVAYSAISNSLVFTPAANLLPSTTYTATITTGVKDLAGNALASTYTWTFTTLTTVNTTPPVLVSTSPANAATDVPLNQAVTGTFNEAMNPLTISTSTFTLTGPGSVSIGGTVTYDAVNFIATFTPTTNLLAGTQYTANITSGATNLTGNPLSTTGSVPNPWVFTTGTAATTGYLGPTISMFGGFAGGAGMTNTGLTTVIHGDSGTTATGYSSYTGFHDNSVIIGGVAECSYTETPANIGLVAGTIYSPLVPTSTFCPLEGTAADIAIAQAALQQATTDYTTLQGLPSTGALPAELGNITLAPGVWTNSSPGGVGITTGPLTLSGGPNDVWVFQIAATLTVGLPATPVDIILTGGAQSQNVYWVVAGAGVYLEPSGGGTFEGTIIATKFIHVSTAANVNPVTVNGRLISLNASTTLVDTVINVPPPYYQ
jgi:hypothetical protein